MECLLFYITNKVLIQTNKQGSLVWGSLIWGWVCVLNANSPVTLVSRLWFRNTHQWWDFFGLNSFSGRDASVALQSTHLGSYCYGLSEAGPWLGFQNCGCRFSEKLQKADNNVTFEWKFWKSKVKKSYFLKICGCKISPSENLWVQLHPLHPH